MSDAPSSLVVRPSGPAPERTSAMAVDEPAPGQYWRCARDLARSRNDRAHHRDVPAGTVLLLTRVEHADGLPHVYEFAGHPSWGPQDPVRVHAEDLYGAWEPAWDGEAVRAEEMNGLSERMAETQRAMMSPPPPADPIALLPAPSVRGETDTQALATADGLAQAQRHAIALRDHSQAQAGWITQHAKVLQNQSQELAHFHQERAQVLLARSQGTLDAVAKVLATVANLELYTGKGLEVVHLREGAPAPAEATLTVYQDLLALDEEALILIAQGGLDHRHTQELATALEDPALLARLIPAERGAVLVRFRREEKDFAPGDKTAASAFYNQHMNREAQQVHLLVRDGERLSLVSSELVFQTIKQLMPSTAEQDRYFQRRDGSRITTDDLSYAKARREQMSALNDYARVLIVLWGLRDRDELFADSAFPRFASWLDEGFQQRFIDLVSQDRLLGETRPMFRAYQEAQNRFLVPGATVAVNLARAVTETSAPGCFGPESWNGHRTHRSTVYETKARTLVARVKTHEGRLCVTFPATASGWRPSNQTARTIQAKLFLDACEDFLVVDRSHDQDLTYYLTSRRQRRDYGAYVELFDQAREAVRRRDAEEAPVRAWLTERARLLPARTAQDADRTAMAVDEALAVVRANRGGEPLVLTDGFEASPTAKALLNLLHAEAAGFAPDRQRVTRALADVGRAPLRLVQRGDDQWAVYATLTTDEHRHELGVTPWVARLPIKLGRDGTVTLGEPVMATFEPRAGERQAHAWDAAERTPTASIERLTPAKVLAALDRIVEVGVNPAWAPDVDVLIEDSARFMRNASKKHVTRLRAVVPVGTGTATSTSYRGKESIPEHTVTPSLVFLSKDALSWAYEIGSAAQRQAVLGVIEKIYAHPERHVKSLVDRWGPVDAPATDTAWGGQLIGLDVREGSKLLAAMDGGWAPLGVNAKFETWDEERLKSRIEDQERERAKNPDARRRSTLTSLTPLGERLVPWARPLVLTPEDGVRPTPKP